MQSNAIRDVIAERERQKQLKFDGQQAGDFDKENTDADWISFIVRYASGAAPRLQSRKDLDFRQAMVKVAAIAIAAIESRD
jgi:hypothetical protein